MRWFQAGDIDGFFGLALDNLVQLLVIVALCGGVLGFPDAILYGHVLPGAAVSLLIGNLYYAWQAQRLARASGREDICALPYGINTPSVFLFIFLVMLPTKLAATAAGATAEEAALAAWRAGLVACFGSGLIELAGSLVAERVRRATPRAAMLATLAGIAVGFISMPFLFRSFGNPLVALVPLAVIFVTYFGRVRFRGRLPGGLIAVALGAVLAWIIGLAPDAQQQWQLGFHLPVPVVGDLVAGFTLAGNQLAAFLSVVLAMGIFNVLGSLQNIESAEAAGDAFPTRPSLAVNGLGTMAAACFGSCFPTTIYIGHPGWKALGARAGYSILNAGFCTLICLTGTVGAIAWAVPIEASLAIVIWIALVITAQSFQATPREQAPAVVVGLLPGIAAWGVMLFKWGLAIGGWGSYHGRLDELAGRAAPFGLDVAGAFALEQGALFTAMILAAMTVAIIGRRFVSAAAWSGIAALLSLSGLMHGYQATPADVILRLGPAWPWFWAYVAIGLFLLAVPWIARRADDRAAEATPLREPEPAVDRNTKTMGDEPPDSRHSFP